MSAPTPPPPPQRASDADRERSVAQLRDAAADGRLDIEELDRRASAAYACRTLSELDRLTADLGPRGAGATGVTDAPGADPGTRRMVSIMGGHDRVGRWRVAARCLVVSVMGGARVDFTSAELSAPVTTIRVLSIMGGVDLRFPAGVDLRVGRLAIMGGHEVRLDPVPPPAGAPVIRLRLLSIMGGGRVRQDPPSGDVLPSARATGELGG